MSNAKIDQNRDKTIIGVSSTDKSTPTNVGVDPNTLALLVESNQVVPTDPTQLSYSLVLSYNGSNQLTQIDKVVSGTTYRKTLTYTGDNLTGVSIWIQI